MHEPGHPGLDPLQFIFLDMTTHSFLFCSVLAFWASGAVIGSMPSSGIWAQVQIAGVVGVITPHAQRERG